MHEDSMKNLNTDRPPPLSLEINEAMFLIFKLQCLSSSCVQLTTLSKMKKIGSSKTQSQSRSILFNTKTLRLGSMLNAYFVHVCGV